MKHKLKIWQQRLNTKTAKYLLDDLGIDPASPATEFLRQNPKD